MSSRPKVLLLDVMDTVVQDPFFEHVPAFFGTSLQKLIEDKHPEAWALFERDEWDEPTFLRHFFADGRDYDHAGMRAALFENYRWLGGMEILLSQLQQDRVPMHWVSNYPSWYREVDRRLGLHQYAPWTFVSCNEGVRKPDPAVFRIVMQKIGHAPQDCLFVDDRDEHCESARSLGLDAVQFTGVEDLRRALEERGLLLEAR